MKYEDYNNEELIDIARSGDMEAREYLFQRNRRLAFKFALNYINRHSNKNDRDDIFSESLVGLLKAYEKFNPDKGFKFNTFAGTVIHNHLYNVMRDLGKQKSLSEVSIYHTAYKHSHGNQQTVTIEDELVADNVGTDKYVMYQEVLKDFMNNASELEKKVYYYCIKKGMMQKDVVNLVGKDRWQVSKIMRRIQERLRSQLQMV